MSNSIQDPHSEWPPAPKQTSRTIVIDGVIMEFDEDRLTVRQPYLWRNHVRGLILPIALWLAAHAFMYFAGHSLYNPRHPETSAILIGTSVLAIVGPPAMLNLATYFLSFGGARFEYDRRTSIFTFTYGKSCRMPFARQLHVLSLDIMSYHYRKVLLKLEGGSIALGGNERFLIETRSVAAFQEIVKEITAFMDAEIVEVKRW